MCTEQYNNWLKSVYYQEEVDMWTQEMKDVTNEELLARPTDERPIEWWNGFTATQEEIDQRRKDSKSSLKWYEDVKLHAPNLDAKAERKKKVYENKLRNVSNCGKPTEFMGKNGLPYLGTYQCKEYDLCPNCAKNRQLEHIERLRELDGCQYIVNERKQSVAEFTTRITYSFKLEDGREITVVKSDEKLENSAGEINWQTIKELKNITVTGTKISGKLGKKEKEEGEPKETRKVQTVIVVIDGTPEQRELATKEFYEKTKDYQPKDLDGLERSIKACAAIYLKLLEKYCEAIHILGKRTLSITEDDLDWSKRQEYIEKWLESSQKTKSKKLEHTK